MNELIPSQQSGFRRNHSTETLLLRLLSDFYSAIDRGQVTLLALFDVSSAFDSVDHSILLQRLSTSFGLVDQPLEWLRSFLTDHSNCVVLGSSRSLWVPALLGCPRVLSWAHCYTFFILLMSVPCWRLRGFCTNYLLMMCKPTSTPVQLMRWLL